MADFNGGDITSDGGLPLLREVDRKIGLIDAINKAVDDPRCQSLVEYDQRTLLTQRILAIVAGYEDLNDHQTLRDDTILKALTDRKLKHGRNRSATHIVGATVSPRGRVRRTKHGLLGGDRGTHF